MATLADSLNRLRPGADEPIDQTSNSNVNRIRRLLGGAVGGGENVFKSFPGGMANFYDDSWGPLLQSLQGGQDASATLTNLLQQFKGKPGDLTDFLEQASPFIMASQANALKQTGAFKHLQDESKWDLGAMAGYGTAAGQLGRGTQQAVQGASQGLAQAGLGRSSARASMTGALRQQGSAAQADLWSRTHQQSQMNRQNSALNAMDAHRTLAQLAMGMQPTPRVIEQGGGSGMGWMGALGAAGSLFGGLGGAIGGIASLFGGGGKK